MLALRFRLVLGHDTVRVRHRFRQGLSLMLWLGEALLLALRIGFRLILSFELCLVLEL
jgi:hypothetical protein